MVGGRPKASEGEAWEPDFRGAGQRRRRGLTGLGLLGGAYRGEGRSLEEGLTKEGGA